MLHRDHAGVMGPVFEDTPVAIMQAVKIRWTIRRSARMQYHVMGASDRIDRINLHEAKTVNDLL